MQFELNYYHFVGKDECKLDLNNNYGLSELFLIKFVTLGNILLERKNNCLILLSNDDKFATPP